MKIIQNMEIEFNKVESLKKIQIKIKLEMKTWGGQTNALEVKSHQQIQGHGTENFKPEDKVEEINRSVKEIAQSKKKKNSRHKTFRKSGRLWKD